MNNEIKSAANSAFFRKPLNVLFVAEITRPLKKLSRRNMINVREFFKTLWVRGKMFVARFSLSALAAFNL